MNAYCLKKMTNFDGIIDKNCQGESLDPILFQDKGVFTQEERLKPFFNLPKNFILVYRGKLFLRKIALTPSGVKSLVENGHSVVIEKDAGLNSHFTNEMYMEMLGLR